MADIHRQDSISRSQPDDLYSVIRNPHTLTQPPQKKVSSDTIGKFESDMERLEREASAKIKSPSIKLPNETLTVIGRAGKTVFFAVALPPYIFIYLIPKWLCMDLLPAGAGQIQKSAEKFREFFETMRVFIQSKLGQLNDRLSSAIQNVFAYFKWLNAAVASAFVHLTHQVISSMTHRLAPFLRVSRRVKDFFQRRAFRFRQKIALRVQNGVKKFTKWRESLLEKIKRLFVQKILAFINNLKARFLSKLGWFRKIITQIVSYVEKQWEKARTKVNQFAKRVWDPIKRSCLYLQNKIYAALQPLINWVSFRIKKIEKFFQITGEKALMVINRVREKIQQKIKKYTAPIKKLVGRLALMIIESEYLKSIKQYVLKQKVRLNKPKKLLGKMRFSKIEHLFKKFQSIFRRILRKIDRFFQWCVEAIKAAPAKIWNGAVAGCYALKKAGRATVYGSRVAFVWTKVIFLYALENLRIKTIQLFVEKS